METTAGDAAARSARTPGRLRRRRCADTGWRSGPGRRSTPARVLGALDLLHREHLREGLAAALLRRSGQRQVFDALFDLYFPAALGAGVGEVDVPRLDDADDGPVDIDALRDVLADLLRDGDTGRADRAGPGGGRRARTLRRGRAPASVGTAGIRAGRRTRHCACCPRRRCWPGSSTTCARGRAAGRAACRRAAAPRDPGPRSRRSAQMITDEVRRRTAEVRGREQVARTAVPRQVDQVEFLIRPRRAAGPAAPHRAPAGPAAGRPGWRCAASTPSAARWTCAARCAARCPPAGCRCARPTAPAGPGARSWWCSATSPARSPGSATSRCCWSRRCASSSARYGCSRSSSGPTR